MRTRIYHVFGEASDPISLKAGTLDDTSGLDPVAHIWIKRAHRWLELERSGLIYHSGEPDNFDRILTAWSARQTR